MASKPPVKIVDPVTDANELTITANGGAEVEGVVADGASVASVNPVLVAGEDPSGDAMNLQLNASGELVVSSGGISGTTNVEFGTTASLAAGASADVDTADIAASTSTLKQISVGGEQPFFFTVSRVENAVVTQISAEMHGQGGETVHWAPQVEPQLTGGAAGLDAWRVSVTNNDNNKAATYGVTIEHLT